MGGWHLEEEEIERDLKAELEIQAEMEGDAVTREGQEVGKGKIEGAGAGMERLQEVLEHFARQGHLDHDFLAACECRRWPHELLDGLVERRPEPGGG